MGQLNSGKLPSNFERAQRKAIKPFESNNFFEYEKSISYPNIDDVFVLSNECFFAVKGCRRYSQKYIKPSVLFFDKKDNYTTAQKYKFIPECKGNIIQLENDVIVLSITGLDITFLYYYNDKINLLYKIPKIIIEEEKEIQISNLYAIKHNKIVTTDSSGLIIWNCENYSIFYRYKMTKAKGEYIFIRNLF